MALRGLAYSVRMAAYNADGVRVTGLAATITATLWADGTAAMLSGITITEIGTTGVYIVPLTAEQMTAYNLCVTATSSTAGITIDPVYLDTEAGRIDVATSTRLATSGYTVPPTVADIQSGLATAAGLSQAVSDIRGDLSTVDTVVDAIAARVPSSGTLATRSDVPTVGQITTAVLGTDVRTVLSASFGSLVTSVLALTSSAIVGSEMIIYSGSEEHGRLQVGTTTSDILPVISVSMTGGT